MLEKFNSTAAAKPWSIQARGLSKSYKVYGKPADMLKEIVTGKPRHRLHHAVRDVSFTMAPGEVVGIIGSNGAGKSTLLKMIAGTLTPTSGELSVKGRVSAILELGTGFHPEYSGRENVFLGGMCLGMTREEVERKYDWIVDFSEIGAAVDQPFKTYSSGMQARLTFATAISMDPEILIIDEALAAGDAYFVVKCGQRVRQLCESGATVLFVSHSTYQVASLCQRAIWIDGGRVRETGDAIDVCRRYDYAVHERLSGGEGKTVAVGGIKQEPAPVLEARPLTDAGAAPAAAAPGAQTAAPAAGALLPGNLPPGSERTSGAGLEVAGFEIAHDEVYRRGPARITSIRWLDGSGRPSSSLRTWDKASLAVAYECSDSAKLQGTFGLSLAINRRRDLMPVAMFSTVNPVRDDELAHYEKAPYRKPAFPRGELTAHFPNLELMEGEYLFSIGIQPNAPGTADFHEYHHMRYIFRIGRNGYPSGAVFHPSVEWRHEAR